MPKIVDKKEKRAEILEAAIRVFAKNGLKNTTIADIAEAVDIGKGTMYQYFESKDQLFAATFLYFMDQVEAAIGKRIFRIQDPLEKLYAYFSAWGEILETEYLDYIEIVLDFWAEGIRNKQLPAEFDVKKMYADYRDMLDSLLQKCIEKGEIRPTDTTIIASTLLGCMDGLVIQWVLEPDIFNLKEAFELTVDSVLQGLKT
ncbi:MAG TPA: TetR family transcriptional regulator [bacterium]|nr:TetR family transcriptional regulator [bacterium]